MHQPDKYHSEVNYRLGPGRAALRKGRSSLPNHAYFITKCVDESVRVADPLLRSQCATLVVQTLRWLVQNRYCRSCGFVVMPDHYHAVIVTPDAPSSSATVPPEKCAKADAWVGGESFPRRHLNLKDIMASLNRHTSRQINERLDRHGRFWEDGYYDHAVRNRQDFDEILFYMQENPVAANLVTRATAWTWSSANPDNSDLIDWALLGPSLNPADRFLSWL